MSNNEENVLMEYVKQISLLAALALIVMWVLVILVAFFASFGAHHEVDQDAVNNRLKAVEVVAVVGGDASAAAETSEPAKEAVTADTGPIDGEAIVTATCFACHGTGILESPKIGDKNAWDKRLEANGDLDGLVQSAVKGKNAMPARGGNAGLSDEQVKAAIEFMMQ